VRNLHLKHEWNSFPFVIRIALLVTPLTAVLFSFLTPQNITWETSLTQGANAFFIIGVVGQLLLNFRFIYQLYHSEKLKDSILPGGFWWLSLGGSVLLVIYAVYRRDPVLLVAQAMAIIPYIRNISVGRRPSSTA
jgi:lipid-A-disaccharide synthase-like uncharacterized protein